jgi:hypothetical protein
MASAAGIIIAAGAITLANEAVSVPYTPGNTNVLKGINWRVIPATAIAAFMFSGLEAVNPTVGRGLAVVALFTTLVVGFGNAPAPALNIANALGYGKDTSVIQSSVVPPGQNLPTVGATS